jgi:hypothetical protein
MKKALLFSGLLLAVNALFAQTWTVSGSNMYLSPTSALLGIGTTTPGYHVDVTGTIHAAGALIIDQQTSNGIGSWFRGIDSGDANVVLQGGGAAGFPAFWMSGTKTHLKIGANGGSEADTGVINIDALRHVGINTLNTSGYTLNVAGTAVFDGITVKSFSGNNPKGTPWADYVFDKDYQLTSLDSLADYIKSNKHLPGIPTTEEVKKDGIDVAATEAKLLEKIEQLTLYTIELQKQIDALKAEKSPTTH